MSSDVGNTLTKMKTCNIRIAKEILGESSGTFVVKDIHDGMRRYSRQLSRKRKNIILH